MQEDSQDESDTEDHAKPDYEKPDLIGVVDGGCGGKATVDAHSL